MRGWLSQGGTLIGTGRCWKHILDIGRGKADFSTARCAAFRERPGRLRAAKNLITFGIDALVICGGDGSLTGADIFRGEWPGLLQELVSKQELTQEEIEPFKHLNIVGMVGSIDNDMSLTDATIGCYSSLSRICEMVDVIDSTASSQ